MSHAINAVIGSAKHLEAAWARLAAPRVQLTPDITLIPMTGQLFDRLRGAVNEPALPPFFLLTPLVVERLHVLDTFGYIETEYFGGSGFQRGAVWSAGKEVVPPREGMGVVNEVLRMLGVVRTETQDEWEVIGLVRFRSMDALVAAAR